MFSLDTKTEPRLFRAANVRIPAPQRPSSVAFGGDGKEGGPWA